MATTTALSESELEHLYLAVFGDLNLCGCGRPETAYDLVRAVLRLAPFYESDHYEQVEALIGQPGAVHIVLSMLDEAGLTEHGSSFYGSWITPKGEWFLWAAGKATFDDLDAVGFPHDGGECPPGCWVIPA